MIRMMFVTDAGENLTGQLVSLIGLTIALLFR